jgi:hypothetical protein
MGGGYTIRLHDDFTPDHGPWMLIGNRIVNNSWGLRADEQQRHHLQQQLLALTTASSHRRRLQHHVRRRRDRLLRRLQMAAALVQSKTGTSALATTTVAFDAAPTSGNLLILSFAVRRLQRHTRHRVDGIDGDGAADVPRRLQVVAHRHRDELVHVHDRLRDRFGVGARGVVGAHRDAVRRQRGAVPASTTADLLRPPTITPTTGARLLHATVGTSLARWAGHPGRVDEQFHGRQRCRRRLGSDLSIATASLAATGDGVDRVLDDRDMDAFCRAVQDATIIAFTVAGTTSPPVNTVAPAVTGTATQGQTLTTDNGTWTNSPTGYTYQWQRYTP